jgi:hypothetical protein
MLENGPFKTWKEFLPIRNGFVKIVETIDKAIEEGEAEDAAIAAKHKKSKKRTKKNG